MKKIFCVFIAMAMLATCLTGCACEHEWSDADCQGTMTCNLCGEKQDAGLVGNHVWIDASCESPKTCKACGLTEGDALGHDWLDATCETAKTCNICHKTDGEPLGHEMTEANYQAPATCRKCNATKGEPLAAGWEKFDIEIIDAEMGVEYEYKTSCKGDPTKKTVGRLVLSDYQVFESNDKYAAHDGYEYQSVKVTIVFDNETAWLHGFAIGNFYDSYYQPKKCSNKVTRTETWNWNGIDYNHCSFPVCDAILSDWDDETKSCEYTCTFLWRVPKGYDGYLLGYYDGTIEPVNGKYIGDCINDDALVFRFANTRPTN